MSRPSYVAHLRQTLEAQLTYGEPMHDIEEGPGRRLATLLRDARAFLNMTQDDAAAASGISRQTYVRYESGRAANPQAEELRAVAKALKIDPREVPIALGYVTRDEMGMPPAEPPLPKTLRTIVSLINDQKIPESARAALLKTVQHAVDLWYEVMGVKKPVREPSAEERAGKKPASKR